MGLGRLGSRHAETLEGLVPGARLVAVSDTVQEKLDSSVRRFPATKAYVDYHDMDLARWLRDGEITQVYAQGGLLMCKELQEAHDIDQASVLVTFADGRLGNREASRNARYGYDVRTEKDVLEGNKPAVTMDNGVKAVEVAAAARKSFETGQPVLLTGIN